MILDNELQFSTAQAITATALSTNVVDLTKVRDIGEGEDFYIGLLVTTAFTDTGSDSTVSVDLVTDDNASLSSPAIVRNLTLFAALTAAGTIRFFKIPVEAGVNYERYIGLNYTVAGGNLTTGAITAFVTKDIQKYKAYAAGFSIL
jgi:hypothetical protein